MLADHVLEGSRTNTELRVCYQNSYADNFVDLDLLNYIVSEGSGSENRQRQKGELAFVNNENSEIAR